MCMYKQVDDLKADFEFLMIQRRAVRSPPTSYVTRSTVLQFWISHDFDYCIINSHNVYRTQDQGISPFLILMNYTGISSVCVWGGGGE